MNLNWDETPELLYGKLHTCGYTMISNYLGRPFYYVNNVLITFGAAPVLLAIDQRL